MSVNFEMSFWCFQIGCGSSLFYGFSKSADAHITRSLKISRCKRWCPKDLRVHAPAAPVLTHSLRKKQSTQIMTGLIFGQNFDCVSGEISAAFPFLCLQRRRMGLNFSFEGFFTLLNTLALAARVVVVLEQCPFIADFFALAAFQVHQKKIFSSDLSLVKNIHV